MTYADTVEAVRATCEAVLNHSNVELVEFKLGPGPQGQLLKIVVDRLDGPLPLGEIEDVSRKLARALDLEDPIEGRYTLEVSSAGIERPLVKAADYARFQGRRAKVKLTEPVEGQKLFKGEIISSNEETFVLATTEGLRFEIPYSAVGKANLEVDWDAELRGIREEE
jgi:ribosome maturation factor RimP